MRDLTVITDSTADLPTQLAASRGIEVVPLVVTFGDETFADGDLTQAEFFGRMAESPELPTTSQPSVGAFVEAYERALEKAEQVVSVHISSRLSGTVESARRAAEQFPGKVHVFDSLNLSWGLAFQVLEAATAVSEGLAIDAVLERLESARSRVKMIVGVDSLENLRRGGRIGSVSAFLGSLFNLKVTFTVGPDGTFVPLNRSRGAKAALEDTMKWVAQQMEGVSRASFAVQHAMAEERALRLRDALRERYDVVEMYVAPAGSVISTHTGTGWGVTVMPQVP